ncbi:substrate-binding periplasmic protein [Rugamonas sp. CCM 8940]|uniref:substrate-binding periplasmic protein n=1 Tax=Rugamonas sp. CCM 8940 TaxID=2765359 RepID=UPI0018F53D09|nr:transporter substrate-binding domain-containing protein [Rugamonas sp. CCM 8940]MBJ7312718.1 transporter substrate-binding domain-containing protein [Rugamonas sp. CCM 8940]
MRRLLLCMAVLLAADAAARPLRLGGFVVAPIVTGSPGAPLQGALREYLEQEVGRRAGVELAWTEATSLPRALENLKNGSIDVLLVSGGTLRNQAGIRVFDWTYLRSRPHLAVLRGSPLRAVDSLRQLGGMEIGWVGGSPLMAGLQRLPIHWQFVASADWQQMNLRKLQAGRIQAAFFENEYSPRHFARREGLDIVLVKLPLPATTFTMAYTAAADPAAIARFERAAAAAFAGEQFKTFLERYMKR